MYVPANEVMFWWKTTASPVDLKMSIVKPLGVHWMLNAYKYISGKSGIIKNGFVNVKLKMNWHCRLVKMVSKAAAQSILANETTLCFAQSVHELDFHGAPRLWRKQCWTHHNHLLLPAFGLAYKPTWVFLDMSKRFKQTVLISVIPLVTERCPSV